MVYGIFPTGIALLPRTTDRIDEVRLKVALSMG